MTNSTLNAIEKKELTAAHRLDVRLSLDPQPLTPVLLISDP